MNYETHIREYKKGERKCPICGTALPAHRTWPGSRHRLCQNPECHKTFADANPKAKFIRGNERKCEAGGCENFLPEGWYWFRPTRLSCSPECWLRHHLLGKPGVFCACGCGEFIQRHPSTISLEGLNFCSRAHLGEYQAKRTIALCGPFVGILEEYLAGFAVTHYRNPKKHKPRLLPFFQYLAESGHTNLEEVTPQTITEFLKWGRTTGRKVVVYSTGTISTFFNWMLSEGRRKAPNPVVSLIHKAPVKHREPRPLEPDQLQLMWKFLNERGDARARFAVAVGQEAGLRIGEIANLRISDVDAIRQRVFVRLPNKTNKERWAYFSEETKRYFVEWMAERNPDCGHDHVLQNEHSDPMTEETLRDLLKRTLCKVHNNKIRNATGFDSWSTHRLRHTMASNLASGGADASTVMAMGGWDSHQAMANYTRVDAGAARRGYDEAMRRAKEQKQTAPRRRVLTPEELLKRKTSKGGLVLPIGDGERCV